MIIQVLLHYGFHLILPGVIAFLFFRDKWKLVWFIMILTILVDLDHLLADPIFDPNRCSIGFHPLHSYYAIGFYLLMCFIPKTRVIGIGLTLHMLTDYQDCMWMIYK